MYKVGWIGLGHMGMPMCKNLVKGGCQVIARDAQKEKEKVVVDMGAVWAGSVKEVAEKADYIFTMIPDGKVLREIVMGKDGLIEGLTPGKILIDMSTVSAVDSAAVNDVLEAQGCKLLRSPVSGSTGPAAQGTLGLMISGDPEVFKQAEPLLDLLGKNKYWLGEKEEARVMKIALNTIVGNISQLLAEAVSLAEKAGIPVEKCMEVIMGSAVQNLIIASKVELINTGKYDPAFTVKMMLKDFDLALDTAKQYEASLPVTSLVRQFYEEAAAVGRELEDYAVLVKRQEENIGIYR